MSTYDTTKLCKNDLWVIPRSWSTLRDGAHVTSATLKHLFFPACGFEIDTAMNLVKFLQGVLYPRKVI